MHVMLKPSWQGEFQRTIRIENRETRKLNFTDRKPIEVDAETLECLRRDFGKALCVCRPKSAKPDWDRTERLAAGESIDDVFADVPEPEQAESEPDTVSVSESLIPEKYHELLAAAGCKTLDHVEALRSGDGLQSIDGIGEASEREILEAMEAHADA